MQPTETYVVHTESGQLLVGVWRGMSAFVDGGRFADAESTLASIVGSPAAPTYSVGYGKIGEGGSVHAFVLLPLAEHGFPVRDATHYQAVVALMLHEGQSRAMDMWSVADRCKDTDCHDYRPSEGERKYSMATDPYPWQYSQGERAHFGDGSRKIMADNTSVIMCRRFTQHDWGGRSRDMGI